MVLKTISPGFGVRASLMLFFCFERMEKSRTGTGAKNSPLTTGPNLSNREISYLPLEVFCTQIFDSGNKTFEAKRLLFNQIL